MDQIGLYVEQAEARIAEGNIPCFNCRQRIAVGPVVIITDDELQGAPEGGSRLMIVGACAICLQEDKMDERAAEVLFVNDPLPEEKIL